MKIDKGLLNIKLVFLTIWALIGCDNSVLDEKPLSFLSPEVTLVSNAGFQSAITALHQGTRELTNAASTQQFWTLYFGTDIGTAGIRETHFRDYDTQMTPAYMAVNYFWEWGYLTMLPRANQIIDYAERPAAVWKDDNEKNAVIAEARFFRAYVYNLLTNLYGAIPIVERLATEPKVDYQRDPRGKVLDFIKNDLEFASLWLPAVQTGTGKDGRIYKAAALHLLSEVYLSIGRETKDVNWYDKAIDAASQVIDGKAGSYKLMTERFGTSKGQPGDVYSDMFKDGNQNRTGGNLENIWVLQFEFQTPGGSASVSGKNWLRSWGPRYYEARDPDNAVGMLLADSLGRGVAWMRPSVHVTDNIWKEDPLDMRNSGYNIRRKWYYNNPASKYYLKEVTYHPNLDTLYHLYPVFRKIEGQTLAGAAHGFTYSDWPVMRLAETYLLRAEAFLLKGDKEKAALDINSVRSRAKAKPATLDHISMDYILDERLRELIVEEFRRLTLNRTGTLVERTKKYNGHPLTINSVKDKNLLFPIPQKFIDANFGAKVEQNNGY